MSLLDKLFYLCMTTVQSREVKTKKKILVWPNTTFIISKLTELTASVNKELVRKMFFYGFDGIHKLNQIINWNNFSNKKYLAWLHYSSRMVGVRASSNRQLILLWSALISENNQGSGIGHYSLRKQFTQHLPFRRTVYFALLLGTCEQY